MLFEVEDIVVDAELEEDVVVDTAADEDGAVLD